MKVPFQSVAILIGTFAVFSSAIASPPVIKPSTSLQHRAVELGKRASFAVTASSDAPLFFQWRLDSKDLPAQTNKSLVLNAVQASDEGDYTVLVSNLDGSVLSEPVRLWVVPPSTNLVKRNYTNDAGLRLPYFIATPANYDPSRSYPLVVFLTGGHADEAIFAGFMTDNPVTRVLASYQQQKVDPVFFVWPCRRSGDANWNDRYRTLVSDLIDRLMSDYTIDTNRVSIGGISGGTGIAWDIVGMRPSLFSAGSMMSGGQGTTRATNLKDLPFWAGCARDDEAGNLGPTQAAVLALRTAGAQVIYTEYNSGGHIGGCTMLASTPAWIHWLLAQRRGRASTTEPMLSISLPNHEAIHATGAASVSLAGSAEALGQTVTRVTWQNTANKTQGDALGTNTWSATGIPLLADKTNVIIVTATTTSWAPALGGNTTFNDNLTVVYSPILTTLALHGTEALLNWSGGGPPYRVQHASALPEGNWSDFLSNAVPPVAIPLNGSTGFYRITGQ
jgi:predicted esterase